MTTGLLERAAHADAERADLPRLFRYDSSSPLDRVGFAKGDVGTIVRGVPIFKEGSFHGGTFTVDAIEIEAMVARFAQLYPDVFVPPVRIDHGWSARDVIGWIVGLSAAVLADPSDGGREKTYLLGDFELVDEDAVEQIRKRKLRNRSSEIGGYETNNGATFPLIIWGVAFVDIPAVEGLDVDGPIKLRTGDPAEIVRLTEGQTMTDPTEPTGDATDTGDATEGTEERVDDVVVDESDGVQGGDGTSEGTDAGDAEATEEPTGEGGTADSTEKLRATPAARIAALRAAGFDTEADEIERLRTEQLDSTLERFTTRGVVIPANRESARTLLSHEEAPVRLAAIALLESFRPPVELDKDRRVPDAPDHSGTGTTKSGLTPGMDADEGGALWASLTTEQRRDPEIVLEYDAWRAALRS